MAISHQKKTVIKIDIEAGLLTKSEKNLFSDMSGALFFQKRVQYSRKAIARHIVLKKYYLATKEMENLEKTNNK